MTPQPNCQMTSLNGIIQVLINEADSTEPCGTLYCSAGYPPWLQTEISHTSKSRTAGAQCPDSSVWRQSSKSLWLPKRSNGIKVLHKNPSPRAKNVVSIHSFWILTSSNLRQSISSGWVILTFSITFPKMGSLRNVHTSEHEPRIFRGGN